MEVPIVTPSLLEQVGTYLGYLMAVSVSVFGLLQVAKPIFLDALQERLGDNGNLYLSLIFITRFILGVAVVYSGGLEPLFETVPFLLELPWALVVIGTGLAVGVESSALYALKELVDFITGKSEPEPVG